MNEVRLIDANGLTTDLKKYYPDSALEGIESKTLFKQILHDIDNAPTVEPEKVLVANVTFDEDKLKEIVNSEVIEKIRDKMFFVREEYSTQPIAVIKVSDLMKHNGGKE